ncbi:unnamed protein product, partial [Staurois parvus]
WTLLPHFLPYQRTTSTPLPAYTGHFYPPSCQQGTSTPLPCLQGHFYPLPATADTLTPFLPNRTLLTPFLPTGTLLSPSCQPGTSTPFLPTGHFYPLPAYRRQPTSTPPSCLQGTST